MSFTGTLDKCKACDKTVYVVDFLSIDGIPYHKACFRCSHCNGTLAVCNFNLCFKSMQFGSQSQSHLIIFILDE